MSAIPNNAFCFFKDGNMWCCVLGDFVNLQESPAGFGKTLLSALRDLLKNLPKNLDIWKNITII